MHRLQRPDPARAHDRWWRAALLVVAVLLAHAWVLQLAARRPGAAVARAPALEVRRLMVSAEAPQPPAVTTAERPAPLVPQPVQAKATRAALALKPARTDAAAPMEVQVLPTDAHPTQLPQGQTAPLPPTRVPASTELMFTLQRGAQSGEARLSWRVDGERYALSLHATLPSGRELEQHSEGGFDNAGLAPMRLADRKRGRDVRAANFQREHGKVTFSGPRWELPLEAGTQDRLSWLVQLVALIGGANEGLRDGTELAMWVVGARGAASHWRFEVRGQQRVLFDGQAADAWWLVREPAHPYDLRVEVWLSPTQGHWPLKVRQTQIPGGEPLDWSLRQYAPSEPGT